MKTGLSILNGIARELRNGKRWNELVYISNERPKQGVLDLAYYANNFGTTFCMSVQLQKFLYNPIDSEFVKYVRAIDKSQKEFTRIWNDGETLTDSEVTDIEDLSSFIYSVPGPFKSAFDNVLYNHGRNPEKLVRTLPTLLKAYTHPDGIVAVSTKTGHYHESYKTKILSRQEIITQLIDVDRRFAETGNPWISYEVSGRSIKIKFPAGIPLNFDKKLLAGPLKNLARIPSSKSILNHIDDINEFNQHVTNPISFYQ
jgi:hypothetical protein